MRLLVAEGAEKLERLEEGVDGRDKVKACVEVLERAWTMVLGNVLRGREQSGDDLGDGDLRCVLVPFYLSRAMERSQATGASGRLRLVERVDRVEREFLAWCAKLELMDDEDLKFWERELDSDDDDDGKPLREKQTAGEQRTQAIARGKRRDDAKKVFHETKNRKKADQQEEDDREVILAEIAYSVARAMDDIRIRKRELDMLRAMAARETKTPLALKQEEEEAARQEEESRAVEDDSQWLRASEDGQGLRVLRLASVDGQLAATRDRIKAAVFEPDARRFPTKSIEQQADEELKDALEREQKEKDAKNDPQKLDQRRTAELVDDGDEDDTDAFDKATKRDEEWDTWREHHPRGEGNKGDHIY